MPKRQTINKRFLLITAVFSVLVLIIVLAVSYTLISPSAKYILSPHHEVSIKNKDVKVGLVLGAGVTKDGKPFKELQARLDAGAAALNKGHVDILLLSGDNRFSQYDEPNAMRKYLIHTKKINKDKLRVDFAGRSTYESCERAAKVFGLKKTIIFSAESHLPRAIYLCRHFGIESYGIANNVEANNSTRREIMARAKAVVNVYLYGEQTVLGVPVKIE